MWKVTTTLESHLSAFSHQSSFCKKLFALPPSAFRFCCFWLWVSSHWQCEGQTRGRHSMLLLFAQSNVSLNRSFEHQDTESTNSLFFFTRNMFFIKQPGDNSDCGAGPVCNASPEPTTSLLHSAGPACTCSELLADCLSCYCKSFFQF